MLHREKKSSNYTIVTKQTNKNSSNKTVQVFLFCFSLQSDKMFMKMLRFNFIRFQQIHCSSFKFETHSYTYQYQKQKGMKYMYDQIYKLKIHLHNVMIRFSAWSLICVNSFFWETAECARQSFAVYVKRIKKTGKRDLLSLNPSWLEHPAKQSPKDLKTRSVVRNNCSLTWTW